MPTLLVIDDDQATRNAIAAVVKKRRFGVFVASDGRTGLDLFQSVRFDTVIVDIFMPGMDGLATTRELRRLDPLMPIIAMSGHAVTTRANGAPDFLKMAVKLGADYALQKPFHVNELFQAIDNCLAGSATIRESSIVAPPTDLPMHIGAGRP